MTEHAQDISERDAVLRERAAHAKAICWALHSHAGIQVPWEAYDACKRCEADAKYKYPLVIQRPRVVTDPINASVQWRVRHGALRMSWRLGEWLAWMAFKGNSDSAPLPERVKMWADLLENPLESVSDPLDLPGAP
jgi:hypothetical protein